MNTKSEQGSFVVLGLINHCVQIDRLVSLQVLDPSLAMHEIAKVKVVGRRGEGNLAIVVRGRYRKKKGGLVKVRVGGIAIEKVSVDFKECATGAKKE